MRRHLTAANVLSTLALFLALTGGAYAAGLLPANSVGSRQLRKNAVTGPKIARNAINSSKVKNGSLLRGDFHPGALPIGPQGPPGPQGPTGSAGPAGTPAVSRVASDTPIAANSVGTGKASCPAGTNALGGGGRLSLSGTDSEVTESYPDGYTGWIASAFNGSASEKTLTVTVMCAATQAVNP
jgi:hypothetical protein